MQNREYKGLQPQRRQCTQRGFEKAKHYTAKEDLFEHRRDQNDAGGAS
jgi:hypothetical protein